MKSAVWSLLTLLFLAERIGSVAVVTNDWDFANTNAVSATSPSTPVSAVMFGSGFNIAVHSIHLYLGVESPARVPTANEDFWIFLADHSTYCYMVGVLNTVLVNGTSRTHTHINTAIRRGKM